MDEREREMGMAHGNRGLADYWGLDVDYGGCIGHGCHGCDECESPEWVCPKCGDSECDELCEETGQ